MSTTAKRVKDARKPKFSSRKHNRCKLCGRPRAFLRKFGVCRLCFRGLALRGEKMYEFLDRLISIALPRVRDFRGVSTKSFDGRGNYTLGVRDQLIFPEIDYARVEKLKGMNITIVTTAKDDNQARALLRQFGMPFRTAA